MADERLTLSGINWRETFAFTHLFRTFRIAIHPSKLILGLLLLLSLYIGGRLLDWMWRAEDRAVPGEIAEYATLAGQPRASQQLADWRSDRQRNALSRYVDLLDEYDIENDRGKAVEIARSRDRYDDLKDAVKARIKAETEAIERRYDEALKAADQIENDDDQEAAERSAELARQRDLAELHRDAYQDLQTAKAIFNQGIFEAFFLYQTSQIDTIVGGILDWNWLGADGVRTGLWNFLVTGPNWLLTQHPLYFFFFLVLFLLSWGIFGGAIARIAAVHAARDEKISVRQALNFSVTKLLSFIFAPIIPLLIIVGIGFVVFAGALIGNIPFIGPILVGLFFFLALAAGFMMALVMLGLLGGFNLMYPTIAVEGSDSFDAISRSFSYVYARPWKMAFYTLIALVYGALCYLFVRFFLYVMLSLAHRFVDCGMMINADNGQDLFSTMWPAPQTLAQLTYDINYLALGVGGDIGASLIAFWVYLTIGLLGAFAISFYFSANTIIYYLMRREVDATEMDDVYVEQLDEEFTETPPAPQETTPAPSGATATATAGGAAAGAGTVATPPSEPPAAPAPAMGSTSAPGESPATPPIPAPSDGPEPQSAPDPASSTPSGPGAPDGPEPQQGGSEGQTDENRPPQS